MDEFDDEHGARKPEFLRRGHPNQGNQRMLAQREDNVLHRSGEHSCNTYMNLGNIWTKNNIGPTFVLTLCQCWDNVALSSFPQCSFMNVHRTWRERCQNIGPMFIPILAQNWGNIILTSSNVGLILILQRCKMIWPMMVQHLINVWSTLAQHSNVNLLYADPYLTKIRHLGHPHLVRPQGFAQLGNR